MNNILKILTSIIFLLSSICVFSQVETVKQETLFMNCLYASLPDGGAEFEDILGEAEDLLIKRELLKDNSGKSYVSLYKNLKGKSKRKFENLGVQKYFYKIILSQQIDTVNQTCEYNSKKVSKEIKDKMKSFNELTMDIKENMENHDEVVANVLALMNPEDFELDYYKFMTFLMLETYHVTQLGNGDIIESSSEYINTDEKVTEYLEIQIEYENKYILENKEVSLEYLLLKVKKHLKKHKSKSEFSFKVNGEVKVATINNLREEIQKVITALRNEFALEKFNLAFDELTEKQQEEIEKTYPNKI